MTVDDSINRSYNEAYEILERISSNNYQWPTNRIATGRRLPSQFENISCVYCRDGHMSKNSPSNSESIYYMGNQNRNKSGLGPKSRAGPSNFYMQSRLNHPPGFSQQAYMEKNDVLIQGQVAPLKKLENHMGQLANEL
ncbi:hypothetical protein EPI10_011368 [Gossypium australe]|uniref:Uncharacterized protein n=1 Tax=Gossypium australe TaxID=47621 RepID=A0A5B6W866_9ROSI|nr:hypothetical protein EPI10_011368 [Gossypium australe]